MLVAAITTTTLLLFALVLVVLVGSVPYGQSRGWGYYPAGGLLGLVLVVLLVLFLLGRLHL